MHQVLFTNRDEAFLEKEHHQKRPHAFTELLKLLNEIIQKKNSFSAV